MNLVTVESSQISAIGYDPATKVLTVQFKAKGHPGSIYTYADAPEAVHRGLMSAESKGKFFGAHVKHAGFKYAKVDQKAIA